MKDFLAVMNSRRRLLGTDLTKTTIPVLLESLQFAPGSHSRAEFTLTGTVAIMVHYNIASRQFLSFVWRDIA